MIFYCFKCKKNTINSNITKMLLNEYNKKTLKWIKIIFIQ